MRNPIVTVRPSLPEPGGQLTGVTVWLAWFAAQPKLAISVLMMSIPLPPPLPGVNRHANNVRASHAPRCRMRVSAGGRVPTGADQQ